ncbi:MAG TPA: glycosyltransferase family 25 protein, partial [Patescibacteria group bacterium]|nr:glycosyltransferase family 25 protein [Patescibacteria group bacterium]
MSDHAPPPIFVISLPSSVQRRAAMAARLNSIGASWRFFDGFDGSSLSPENYPDYDRTRRRLFFGKDLTPGEMGCLL